jgi:hypothetical protein
VWGGGSEFPPSDSPQHANTTQTPQTIHAADAFKWVAWDSNPEPTD